MRSSPPLFSGRAHAELRIRKILRDYTSIRALFRRDVASFPGSSSRIWLIDWAQSIHLAGHNNRSCDHLSGLFRRLHGNWPLSRRYFWLCLRNLIRPRCAEWATPGRGKPVLIMHIGFSLVFTPYLSNAVVSAKFQHYFSCPCSTEAVGIAHKPPHSL